MSFFLLAFSLFEFVIPVIGTTLRPPMQPRCQEGMVSGGKQYNALRGSSLAMRARRQAGTRCFLQPVAFTVKRDRNR